MTSFQSIFRARGRASDRARGWRPTTLSAPVLLSFTVVSICLAIVLEVLSQLSLNQGGLALASSPDNIPLGVSFAYLVLPTLISVFYGLAWAWINLDAQRLQPWLELSNPEGATADMSLLLDYPNTFMLFVPWKAAKLKHWPVFLSGSLVLIITWVIIPLQGAIFALEAVTVEKDIPFVQTARLLQAEKQADRMDISIIHNTRATTWLNQSLPAFTTTSYALLPFQPEEARPSSAQSGTYTATTSKFWTDSTCWPATSVPGPSPEAPRMWDNGRGCQATGANLAFDNLNYDLKYRPVKLNDKSHCPGSHDSSFLLQWMDRRASIKDFKVGITLFCEPSYFKQRVTVTVSSVGQQPDEGSIVPLGDPETLTSAEFDHRSFETLVGMGVPSVSTDRDAMEGAKILFPPTGGGDSDLERPLDNMVGLAFSYFDGNVSRLRDGSELAKVFDRTRKAAFAMTIAQLMTGSEQAPLGSGRARFQQHGIVAQRRFAVAVEALLLLVALLTIVMLVLHRRSQSKLQRDVVSISDLCSIVQESDPLLGQFSCTDEMDEKGLRRFIRDHKYRLSSSKSPSQGDDLRLDWVTDATANSLTKCHDETPSPSHPVALGPFTGSSIIILLLLAAGGLAALKGREVVLNGLSLSTTDLNMRILTNYLPIVFATALEPFFILLTRYISLMQPFHDLKAGQVTRSKAFDTRYGSLPPQLNIFRAFKSRHFILAILCVLAFLTNVLTVALGALFSQLPITVDSSATFESSLLPTLNRGSFFRFDPFGYEDHFYTTMSNITTDTDLPPWVDTRFAYLPFFDSSQLGVNDGLRFEAETTGFGFEPYCVPVSTSPSTGMYVKNEVSEVAEMGITSIVEDEASEEVDGAITSLGENDVKRQISEPFEDIPDLVQTSNRTMPPHNRITLVMPEQPGNESREEVQLTTAVTGVFSPGLLAMEISYQVPNNASVVFGWARINTSEAGIDSPVSMTILHCVPVLKTATFRVVVDKRGRIQQSRQISDLVDGARAMGEDHVQNITRQASENLALSSLILFDGGRRFHRPDWHNSTVTKDWFTYMLKLSTNDTRLVDPSQPLLTASEALLQVEPMVRRLTALLIGLNFDMFNRAETPLQITGTTTKQEQRIFMNVPALAISLAILVINIAGLTFLYTWNRKAFLPRLPSSIAALIAYVAPSRAVREVGRGVEGNDKATYSFGWYIGTDREKHLGIEVDPLVVPYEQFSEKGGSDGVRDGLHVGTAASPSPLRLAPEVTHPRLQARPVSPVSLVSPVSP